MSELPPRPNFGAESQTYFLVCVDRAIQQQDHVVEMSRWRLPDLINSEIELIEDWMAKGWVEFDISEDSFGHTHKTVTILPAGFSAAKRLKRRIAFKASVTKHWKNFLPVFNTLSAFVAAVAAVAAAYFSYLTLSAR